MSLIKYLLLLEAVNTLIIRSIMNYSFNFSIGNFCLQFLTLSCNICQASHTKSNIGQIYTVPEEISTRVLSYFLTKRFQSEVTTILSNALYKYKLVNNYFKNNKSGLLIMFPFIWLVAHLLPKQLNLSPN